MAVKALIYKIFGGKAILRVENTTEETAELIFEITSRILKTAEKSHSDITGSIYTVGEVQYVNIVMQNDEISN